MTCPTCGIENVPSAEYCDCGHEFVSGSKPEDWTPEKTSDWSGLFSVKRILQCWAVGVVAVFVFGALAILAPSVGLVIVVTFPLWILPALLGMSTHDISVLMFLGGSVLYGAVCFAVLTLIVRAKKL